MSHEWLDYLYTQRQVVQDSLASHMGNETMCQIHSRGHVTGGIKYDEGRMIVIEKLVKLAQTQPTKHDLQASVQALRDEWAAQLQNYQGQQPVSMAWVGYSQGGVDAIERFHQYLAENA